MIVQNLFKDQVVVIVGGAQGIGKNIARIFGQQGAIVVIVDKESLLGQQTVNEFKSDNIKAHFFHQDISKPKNAKLVIQKTVQKFKRIDVLVNNARAAEKKDLLAETKDNWRQGMAVLLDAPFFTSQEAIRFMKKQQQGCILNMSSCAAIFACNEAPVYHVAKAGILQMTRYLAAFAGPFGIRVNALLPGFIIKDEHRARYELPQNASYRKIVDSCHPLMTPGYADDVAHTALWLCSSWSKFVTGQCLFVDGGLSLKEISTLVFDSIQRS